MPCGTFIHITISIINTDLLSDQCGCFVQLKNPYFSREKKTDSLFCVELEDVRFTLTDRTHRVVRHPGVVSRPGLVAPVLPSPLRDQPGNKLRERGLLGELAQSYQLENI